MHEYWVNVYVAGTRVGALAFVSQPFHSRDEARWEAARGCKPSYRIHVLVEMRYEDHHNLGGGQISSAA